MKTDKCLFLTIKTIGVFLFCFTTSFGVYGQGLCDTISCINVDIEEFTSGSWMVIDGYDNIGETTLFCGYQNHPNPIGLRPIFANAGTDVIWYFDNMLSSDGFSSIDTMSISQYGADTIFVEAEFDLDNTPPSSCTCMVIINGSNTPEVNQNITIPLCDDDTTFEGFDVNSINTDDISTDSDNISYYLSEDFAESGNNPIMAPIDVNSGNEIFARVEDMNNPDCFSISTIEFDVNLNPMPTITTVNDTLDCNNNDAVITTDPGFSNYDWSVTNGGTLSGSGNTQTLTVDESGDYNVMLIVTDANQCMGTATLDEDIVAIFDPPQFDNTPISTTPSGVTEIGCANPTIELTANINPTSNNLSYQWSINGAPIMNSNSEQLEISSDGNYSVVVTNIDNGCSTDPATITITDAMDQPEPVTSIEHNCDDSTVSIMGSASMTMGATYSWAATAGGMIDGNPNQEDITATSAGTYILTITQGTCMVASDPVVISAVGNPTVLNDSLLSCLLDGVATFNLTEATVSNTSDITITYHENLGDAETNNNIISDSTNHEISEDAIVYARIERNNNNCYDISEIMLDVEMLIPPTMTFSPPLEMGMSFCTQDSSVITVSVDNVISGYDYRWTLNGANAGVINEETCAAIQLTANSNIVSLTYKLGECEETVPQPITLNDSDATDAKVFQFADTDILFCNRNDFASYQWGRESKTTLCPEPDLGGIGIFQDYVVPDGIKTDDYYYWVIVTDFTTGCTNKIYLENNTPFSKLTQNPDIEYGNLALQITPNPNDGAFELTITGDEIRNLDVHLYDALGRAIYHQDAFKENGIETYYIAVPNLTQGMYFVRVTGNDGILLTEKIIVK